MEIGLGTSFLLCDVIGSFGAPLVWVDPHQCISLVKCDSTSSRLLSTGSVGRQMYARNAMSKLPGFHFQSFRSKIAIVSSVLILACTAADLSSAAGTGAGMQVPNPPSGRFTQRGAPGRCQCIAVDTGRPTICITSAAECEGICGKSYAFLPDASLSCPAEAPSLTGSGMPPKARRQ